MWEGTRSLPPPLDRWNLHGVEDDDVITSAVYYGFARSAAPMPSCSYSSSVTTCPSLNVVPADPLEQLQGEAMLNLRRKIGRRSETMAMVTTLSASVLSKSVIAAQLSMYQWNVTEAQTLAEVVHMVRTEVVTTWGRNMERIVRCGGKFRSVDHDLDDSIDLTWMAGAAADTVVAAPPPGRVSGAGVAAADLLLRLVLVDRATHEPFEDIIAALRALEQEIPVRLVVVLLLEAAADRVTGLSEAQCIPTADVAPQAYAAGYDLVLARPFDHVVVEFLTTMFMSSSGRWRNDLRAKAAVGNYVSVRSVLLGNSTGGNMVVRQNRGSCEEGSDSDHSSDVVGGEDGAAGHHQRSLTGLGHATVVGVEAAPGASALAHGDCQRGPRSQTQVQWKGSDSCPAVDLLRPLSEPHHSHPASLLKLSGVTNVGDTLSEVMRPSGRVLITTKATTAMKQKPSPSGHGRPWWSGGGSAARAQGASMQDDDDDRCSNAFLVDENVEMFQEIIQKLEGEVRRLEEEKQQATKALQALQSESGGSAPRRRRASESRSHSVMSESVAPFQPTAPLPPLTNLSKEQQIYLLKQRLEEANEYIAQVNHGEQNFLFSHSVHPHEGGLGSGRTALSLHLQARGSAKGTPLEEAGGSARGSVQPARMVPLSEWKRVSQARQVFQRYCAALEAAQMGHYDYDAGDATRLHGHAGVGEAAGAVQWPKQLAGKRLLARGGVAQGGSKAPKVPLSREELLEQRIRDLEHVIAKGHASPASPRDPAGEEETHGRAGRHTTRDARVDKKGRREAPSNEGIHESVSKEKQVLRAELLATLRRVQDLVDKPFNEQSAEALSQAHQQAEEAVNRAAKEVALELAKLPQGSADAETEAKNPARGSPFEQLHEALRRYAVAKHRAQELSQHRTEVVLALSSRGQLERRTMEDSRSMLQQRIDSAISAGNGEECQALALALLSVDRKLARWAEPRASIAAASPLQSERVALPSDVALLASDVSHGRVEAVVDALQRIAEQLGVGLSFRGENATAATTGGGGGADVYSTSSIRAADGAVFGDSSLDGPSRGFGEVYRAHHDALDRLLKHLRILFPPLKHLLGAVKGPTGVTKSGDSGGRGKSQADAAVRLALQHLPVDTTLLEVVLEFLGEARSTDGGLANAAAGRVGGRWAASTPPLTSAPPAKRRRHRHRARAATAEPDEAHPTGQAGRPPRARSPVTRGENAAACYGVRREETASPGGGSDTDSYRESDNGSWSSGSDTPWEHGGLPRPSHSTGRGRRPRSRPTQRLRSGGGGASEPGEQSDCWEDLVEESRDLARQLGVDLGEWQPGSGSDVAQQMLEKLYLGLDGGGPPGAADGSMTSAAAMFHELRRLRDLQRRVARQLSRQRQGRGAAAGDGEGPGSDGQLRRGDLVDPRGTGAEERQGSLPSGSARHSMFPQITQGRSFFRTVDRVEYDMQDFTRALQQALHELGIDGSSGASQLLNQEVSQRTLQLMAKHHAMISKAVNRVQKAHPPEHPLVLQLKKRKGARELIATPFGHGDGDLPPGSPLRRRDDALPALLGRSIGLEDPPPARPSARLVEHLPQLVAQESCHVSGRDQVHRAALAKIIAGAPPPPPSIARSLEEDRPEEPASGAAVEGTVVAVPMPYIIGLRSPAYIPVAARSPQHSGATPSTRARPKNFTGMIYGVPIAALQDLLRNGVNVTIGSNLSDDDAVVFLPRHLDTVTAPPSPATHHVDTAAGTLPTRRSHAPSPRGTVATGEEPMTVARADPSATADRLRRRTRLMEHTIPPSDGGVPAFTTPAALAARRLTAQLLSLRPGAPTHGPPPPPPQRRW